MHINSIQPKLYSTQQKIKTHTNISHQGIKGAIKGAIIGGGLVGGICVFAIGAPAAAILGCMTAGLSAIIGSEEEDRKNDPNYPTGSDDDYDSTNRYLYS